jgi:hypothetical protein
MVVTVAQALQLVLVAPEERRERAVLVLLVE